MQHISTEEYSTCVEMAFSTYEDLNYGLYAIKHQGHGLILLNSSLDAVRVKKECSQHPVECDIITNVSSQSSESVRMPSALLSHRQIWQLLLRLSKSDGVSYLKAHGDVLITMMAWERDIFFFSYHSVWTKFKIMIQRNSCYRWLTSG